MKHVKAVIFDWAGTVVDYGSLAPMGAFVETFAEFGVEISIDEARGPMGMAKRPHIAALAAMPRIAEAWTRKHGRAPTDGDIDALYDVFVPKNVAVAAHYADVIPGTAEVVSALRAEGVKIGSSTGYTREIMAQDHAPRRRAGISARQPRLHRRHPRGSAEPADVLQGPDRPRRLAGLACDQGGRHDGRRREGVNAGAWAVGVAVSGNAFGLSLADASALSPEEFMRRRARAQDALYGAGAHYVINSVADLLPVVAQIEGRLARGERP